MIKWYQKMRHNKIDSLLQTQLGKKRQDRMLQRPDIRLLVVDLWDITEGRNEGDMCSE